MRTARHSNTLRQRCLQLLVVVVAFATAPLGSQEAAGSDASVDSRRVTELPGWGIKVSKGQRERLQAATLKIGIRRRERSSAFLQPNCTAVKVRLDSGSAAALTAAHCFRDLAGRNVGLQTQEARDLLTPDLTDEYLLFDPEPGASAFSRQIARITGIAVVPGLDMALLAVDATESKIGAGAFDDLPALSLRAMIAAPVAGQTVALSSVPSASGDELIGGTGVYLGRIRGYNASVDINESYDVVVESPRRPSQDPGYFGGSGSAAMLEEGLVLPSLSGRAALGYGSKPPTLPDVQYGWVYWRDVEFRLNVHLPKSKFNVLLYYAVAGPQTLARLQAGLGKHLAKPWPS